MLEPPVQLVIIPSVDEIQRNDPEFIEPHYGIPQTSKDVHVNEQQEDEL